MPNHIYYIYRITNTSINPSKSYIGFTSKNPEERFKEHLYDASHKLDFRNSKYGRLLPKAIRKYSPKSFALDILYCSQDEEHTLKYMEEYFIRLYQTHYKEGQGYNMTYGGEGTKGHLYNITEETKLKISNSMKGKKKTKEHQDHINASRKGYKHSEETCKKISAIQLGKKRKPLSEETKRKISLAHKGMKASDETKAKLCAAHKRRKTRATMTLAAFVH
jgi:group I intron endonuclease